MNDDTVKQFSMRSSAGELLTLAHDSGDMNLRGNLSVGTGSGPRSITVQSVLSAVWLLADWLVMAGRRMTLHRLVYMVLLMRQWISLLVKGMKLSSRCEVVRMWWNLGT